MNKTEKEYYKKCTTPVKSKGTTTALVAPICVYYDTEKGRCELNYCYRQKGGLLNR